VLKDYLNYNFSIYDARMEMAYAKKIQLIKIGNKAWSAKDVAKMRG
jgi:hypothetical protein